MKFIIDAHLDLSMNAMEWNRDLRHEVSYIRKSEAGLKDFPDREKNTVSFPAMRKGNIGICVATLIARYVKPNNPLPGWNSPEQAWAQTQAQLAWYRAMEKDGALVQLKSASALKQHFASWQQEKELPLGYVLSLEGADSIVSIEHLELMYKEGLRAIGAAHYGPGTYAHGTDSEGGIGQKGKDLVRKVEELGLILDLTHLCDISFWETLDCYDGPLWASHSNCRTLVPNHRQFSDEQIKAIVARKGIIGMAFDAWMIIPDWKRGITTPKGSGLKIETIIAHIDHICQLTGSSENLMIGSDLDGGFGKEQCPYDLETIADLQKLDDLLSQKGYSSSDIDNILYKNALHFLETHL